MGGDSVVCMDVEDLLRQHAVDGAHLDAAPPETGDRLMDDREVRAGFRADAWRPCDAVHHAMLGIAHLHKPRTRRMAVWPAPRPTPPSQLEDHYGAAGLHPCIPTTRAADVFSWYGGAAAAAVCSTLVAVGAWLVQVEGGAVLAHRIRAVGGGAYLAHCVPDGGGQFASRQGAGVAVGPPPALDPLEDLLGRASAVEGRALRIACRSTAERWAGSSRAGSGGQPARGIPAGVRRNHRPADAPPRPAGPAHRPRGLPATPARTA